MESRSVSINQGLGRLMRPMVDQCEQVFMARKGEGKFQGEKNIELNY